MSKTITGTWTNPNGTPAANATLKLDPSYDNYISGTTQVTRNPVYVTLDATGAIPAGTTIIADDEVGVSGAYHNVSVKSPGFGIIFGTVPMQLVGTSPINLNNIAPYATGTYPEYPNNYIGGVTVTGEPTTAGQVIASTSTTTAQWQSGVPSSTPFTDVESGTNTTATMTVGSGAQLTYSGSGIIQASKLWNLTNQTTTYTANPYDDVWCVGTFTVSPPPAVSGARFRVRNQGTGVITVAATINGNANMLLQHQYSAVELSYNGSTWGVE